MKFTRQAKALNAPSVSAIQRNREQSRRQKLAEMFMSDQNVVRPRRNSAAWANQNRKARGVGSRPQDWNHPVLGLPYSLDGHNTNHGRAEGNASAPKRSVPCSTVRRHVQEFCEVTSLHGLRYVGAENVTLGERIFWVVAFLGAVAFATYFIMNIYDKWEFSPVIVGINPQFTSISSIPFPAITICNMNQAKKSVAKKIDEGDDEVEKHLLEDFCNLNESLAYGNMTDENNLSNWDNVKKFMLKVSQPCSEMMYICKWQTFDINCSDIINSALTDEGICCTFNRVSSEYMYYNPWVLEDFKNNYPEDNIDWTPESGYPDNTTNTTWPYRPPGAGSHLGLTIVANVATDDYYCSSTSSIGLKIKLHSPVETPKMADFGFIIHSRKESRIVIKPNMDEASSSIFTIPISKRQCVFQNERKLTFYRTYTKQNCELECESNYTLTVCSCVPFYLPKNLTTRICGKKKEACFRRAKADMETSHQGTYCNCLPGCFEISYGQEHSIGDIANSNLLKFELKNSMKLHDIIIMHFYFASTQFRSYQKSELFGFTEFLSNTGGLLGLFLGFSFLSAVEIGYHLTLKIWCAYRKKEKKAPRNVVIYPFAK